MFFYDLLSTGPFSSVCRRTNNFKQQTATDLFICQSQYIHEIIRVLAVGRFLYLASPTANADSVVTMVMKRVSSPSITRYEGERTHQTARTLYHSGDRPIATWKRYLARSLPARSRISADAR